jgi:hypothetical protein
LRSIRYFNFFDFFQCSGMGGIGRRTASRIAVPAIRLALRFYLAPNFSTARFKIFKPLPNHAPECLRTVSNIFLKNGGTFRRSSKEVFANRARFVNLNPERDLRQYEVGNLGS